MKRGYIGVILKTEEFQVDGESPSYSLRSVYGATIKKIIPKSPSYSFGLKEGDIILDINGSTIRDATQATRAIGALKPDELIDIIIRRRNKTYKVKIMIGERPSKSALETINDEFND
jgi:serine protease Do